jgi:hypothetical protein
MEKKIDSRKASGLFKDRLKIIKLCGCAESSMPSKADILCEQILDSTIVGGVAGVSTYIAAGSQASFESAVLAFVFTFLIKLKEYRKIQ